MFRKNTLAPLFLLFLCFSIICCNVTSADQLEDYLSSLEQDVFSKTPVYAVSVTRKLKHNSANYSYLTRSKRFVILSILNCFLAGQHVDKSEFEKQLREYVNDEIREYEEITKELGKYKNNSKEYREAQERLEEIKIQLVTFWKNVFQKKSKGEAEKLIQNYISTYVTFNENQNYLLKNNKAIVVFNELFFGKDSPTYKGIIEKEVIQLSLKNPNKMFHVNFLTTEERFFLDKQKVAQFVDTYKGDASLFDTQGEFDYKYYFNNLLLLKSPLTVLENISRIYINGIEKAFYNKSSYHMEDNASLKKGVFYVFGKGIDTSVVEISNLEGDIVKKQVSEYLNQLYTKILPPKEPKLISTEICYDLTCGIRYKHNLYPVSLMLHIVPSNTLDFDENKNMKYLPQHSLFIFHIDPNDSALYKKVPVVTPEGKVPKFHKIDNGLCTSIFEFTLDESAYCIKAWNLSSLL